MYGRGKTRTVMAVAVTLPLLVGISSPSSAAGGANSAKDQISVTSETDQISVTGKGNKKDRISVFSETDQISVTNK